MDIAYLISAHADAPQFKRLIEALHPDADYYVHIDKKSDIRPFTSLIEAPNVHFISRRIDVVWGTMREVAYQMALLKATIDAERHYDYIFFLSGMDYPLYDVDRITRYLEKEKAQKVEILQGICMDTPQLIPHQRELYTTCRPFLRWKKLSILARLVGKMAGCKKPLHFEVNGKEWKLYKGSAWWCISQELAEYVWQTYREVPQVRRYFRTSFCPAETLIQTIAFNAPMWAPHCLLTQGKYTTLAALTPLHFIDYNPVIKVLDAEDFPRLIQSGKMFCRKVVSGRSDELVRMIQEKHRSSSLEGEKKAGK